MWIYGTVSEQILDTILQAKSTSRDLWLSLEAFFRDNKEARALQIDNELRTLQIGDISIQDYCHKLKYLSDLLSNVNSPISDLALVMHMLNGLSDKFDNIINVITHHTPFPSFTKARSMLLIEEGRLAKSVKPSSQHTDNPSSPDVLYTNSDQQQQYHYNNQGARGYGRNNRGRGRGGRNNCGRGRNNSYGHQNNPWQNKNAWLPPWSPNPYAWPFSPTYPPAGYSQPPPQQAAPYPLQHQTSNILGPYQHRPHGEAHLAHVTPPSPSVGSSNTHFPSALSQAFNTMNLQDPFGQQLVYGYRSNKPHHHTARYARFSF